MKLTRDNIFRILPFITALIAVILFCISAIEERTEGKTEHVAASAGKKSREADCGPGKLHQNGQR